jgi:hypothetical protein
VQRTLYNFRAECMQHFLTRRVFDGFQHVTPFTLKILDDLSIHPTSTLTLLRASMRNSVYHTLPARGNSPDRSLRHENLRARLLSPGPHRDDRPRSPSLKLRPPMKAA